MSKQHELFDVEQYTDHTHAREYRPRFYYLTKPRTGEILVSSEGLLCWSDLTLQEVIPYLVSNPRIVRQLKHTHGGVGKVYPYCVSDTRRWLEGREDGK